MFGHKKAYIISMFGADKTDIKKMELFLKENDIAGKVLNGSVEIKELV